MKDIFDFMIRFGVEEVNKYEINTYYDAIALDTTNNW